MGQVIGRESERETLVALVRDPLHGPRTVVIRGEAGIGKTTLWEEAVTEARPHAHVLAVRAVEAEAKLAYGGLTDLIGPAAEEVLGFIPAPQRAALEVALLRSEPGDAPSDPRALGTAVLQVLRRLAAAGPLVVAIDDVQWLDPSTADALRFAARRLQSEPVLFLLARRGSRDDPLEFAAGTVVQVDLDPLAETTLARLLVARIEPPPPRGTIKRIHEVSGGNPFHALELAGAVQRSAGTLQSHDPVPVPPSLRQLVSSRLEQFDLDGRRTLLAAAMLGAPTRSLLQAAVGAEAGPMLDEAQRAGVVEIHDDSVRFAHPLFASVLLADTPSGTRVELHRVLAAVVDDPEQRARHLALASGGAKDARIADQVERGAAHASARGAAGAAAELFEQAARLTDDDTLRAQRLLAAARHRIFVWEPQRADELAAAALPLLADEAMRGDAILVRASASLHDVPRCVSLLDAALATTTVPAVRAQALSLRAVMQSALLLRPVFGLSDAREALEAAEASGSPDLVMLAAGARAWAEVMLAHTPSPTPATPARPFFSPARPLLARLVWRGELAEARAPLVDLRQAGTEAGDDESAAAISLHLAELELRAGDFAAARRHADTVADYAAHVPTVAPAAAWLAAAIAARVGDLAETQRQVERGAAASRAGGYQLFDLLCRAESGHAALAAEDPAAAAAILAPLFELLVERQLDEPGEFPLVPDLVEAQILLDEPAEAEAALAWLDERAQAQGHPWGLGTAARCRGLLLAARRDLDGAAAELATSVAGLESFGLAFDAARSRLALGSVLRRAQRRQSAREQLQSAAELFAGFGAETWAERARVERDRVGGRTPAGNELTSMQQRVAELAGAGRSNKQIAAQLSISEHTVESHLKRVFQKLGVRSRTELSRRILRP